MQQRRLDHKIHDKNLKLGPKTMQIYPWQTSQWNQITQQFTQGLPHALMLVGPNGLGKTAFAKALSAWLLCHDRGVSHSCGQCHSCQWIENHTHPDFFILHPENANVIKIDQIRALKELLSQTSVQSGYKVVLIEPLESMNTASFNALLKTLEEPLGNVVFILVTHKPNQIPLTIQSRVQSIKFKPPSREIAKSWLSKKISGPVIATDLLLSLTGNLPLKALELAEQETFLNERNQLFSYLKELMLKQSHPVQIVEKILKYNGSLLFEHWFSIVTDLMRFMMGINDSYLVHQDKIENLSFFAENISLRSLLYYQHELRKALWSYHCYPNLNQALLLEHLCIQWRKMCS